MSRRVRRILTPEHVPLTLEPAGLGSRFLALVVDGAILVALSSLVAGTLGLALPAGLGMAIGLTVVFVLTWGYHVWFEVRHGGRTLGKRLFGLRVVDGRGLPLTVQQSFVRNVARVLDAAPIGYGVGALTCLLDRDRRRLGDLIADTLVVVERRPPPAPRVRLPEVARGAADRELGHRARAHLEVEERELVFDLVRRADGLTEAARYDLMEEAALHLRRRVGVDAPHLSGENYVRTVAASLADR